MEFGALLETLDEGSRRSIDAIRELSAEAFAAPTRCPPWDVRVLVGHTDAFPLLG
ncbi:MAG: maleylpyruvate isomerase N-terminal domain-containing protein [Actinomycetota bacterium]